MKAVSEQKGKRIGKVRRFVFHPSEKRCIGFLVKRPDAALMFHRKDLFVAIDGFRVEAGEIIVSDRPSATDKGAVKALGVDWDACVLWVGMPVITQSDEFLGYVDTVWFNAETGDVHSVSIENGMANDVVLGKRKIPASLIRGFKRGRGAALVDSDDYQGENVDDASQFGAIMVDDAAMDAPIEGGAAATAGKATAVVTNRAKKEATKAKAAIDEQVEKAKPKAKKAAKRASEAADAGAFAAGKQLGKATGMFSAFKEEYNKAKNGEDE